jgi:hypothetical protein
MLKKLDNPISNINVSESVQNDDEDSGDIEEFDAEKEKIKVPVLKKTFSKKSK